MTTNDCSRLTRLSAIALAVGGMALAGCSPREQADARTDARQAGAETRADARQAGAELKADARQAGTEMKADLKEAAADAKAKTGELRADASTAMDKAKVSVADATITAGVKAELAKDSVLKARDINVDTEGGRVVLRGTAPTAEARDRASTLARTVGGVVSVKNDLTVAAG